MARILVIEDNPNNLELMRYLLSAAGHDVSCATTSRAGLSAATAEVPDLVIMDIQLPDASGYDVLTWMRADARLAGQVIVAVTANAMVGDRDNALAAGFDSYISKPIDPREFSATIDALLPPELRGHAPRHQWESHSASRDDRTVAAQTRRPA